MASTKIKINIMSSSGVIRLSSLFDSYLVDDIYENGSENLIVSHNPVGVEG